MYRHDENTEARSQTRTRTTLVLVHTDSHFHYTDKPNKETYAILFTLPLITNTTNT